MVCQIGMLSYEFPPALKPPEDLVVLGKDASGQPIFNSSAKHWTNFVITENANDAIGILNNSASFNKMSIEYKYEMMPNRTWRCRVFLQDHCLAEGYGTKKTSKHAAADEALKVLQKNTTHLSICQKFPVSLRLFTQRIRKEERYQRSCSL